MPKMSRKQYIASKFLLAGYNVYRVRRHKRFIRRNCRQGRAFWVNEGEDVAGVDLIAWKNGSRTLFIQIGTGYMQLSKANYFRKFGFWTDDYSEILVIIKVVKKRKRDWRVFRVSKGSIRETCVYDNVLKEKV